MEKNTQIQLAGRIFLVLEELAASENGLGVSELSRQTSLHKTTVFRILNSLVNLGYVNRAPGTDKYRLSLKMFALGSQTQEVSGLRGAARPFLQRLADRTEEIVHLAVLNGEDAIYIDKIEGSKRMVRIFSQLGKPLPLHCTGLGKVLLSGQSDEFAQKLAEKKGLEKFTDNTLTNLEDLKRELAVIREQGYATDNFEHEEGLCCIAAPVFGSNDSVAAAISLSYLPQYTDDERRAAYIKEVLQTAQDISTQYRL